MPSHFRYVVPQFPVADVAHTARYYEQKLGFEVSGYWDGDRVHHDDAGDAFFGIVQCDGVRLHFNRARPHPARSDGGYDVYFHIRGIDDLARELRERGADIVEGPSDRLYGQRELVVRDCNGLLLAFGDEGSEDASDSTATVAS